MRYALWWLMDHACAWTGHDLFLCWNRPRWVNRVWAWANDLEVG